MAEQRREQFRETVQDWANWARDTLRPAPQPSQTPVPSASEPPTTVIFDDEQEYIRFTDYVYDRFGGEGVSLTNVPIALTVRVAPWLLQKATQDGFSPRPVDENDLTCLKETLRDRQPFDVQAAEALHIPGTPDPTTRRPQR